MTTTVFSGFAVQFTFASDDGDTIYTNTGLAPVSLKILSNDDLSLS